jgi:hypothetical protein
MKLKETSVEQRAIAGFVALIVFVHSMMTLAEMNGKFDVLCELNYAPAKVETATLGFYNLLATLGAVLGMLHMLAPFKLRK